MLHHYLWAFIPWTLDKIDVPHFLMAFMWSFVYLFCALDAYQTLLFCHAYDYVELNTTKK